MKKNIVRLTENDLRNIIKKSVTRIIREGQYMDDGNLEPQYSKNPDSMWTYGSNLNPDSIEGMDPHSVRRSGLGNKKRDNLASWDYFDAVSNGADMKMRDRLNADYDERNNPSMGSDYHYGYDDKDSYINSRKRDLKKDNSEFNGFYDDMKQDLDKSWNDTKDIEKYNRQADTRKLHRKGSLNRAFEENTIREMVKEAINDFFNKK